MVIYGLPNNNTNNNANLARQLQAQFNREAAVANQAAFRENVVPLPVAVMNALQNNVRNENNAANMRRAKELAIYVAEKLVASKRALVGAGRAAARGSMVVARKISEKAERLAREALERAPDRQVVKDYARTLMQRAKSIFSATKNTLIRRGRNILARYARAPNRMANRQANAGPLARAPSNANTTVNTALNRIGLKTMSNRDVTATRLASLSDRVPEFFMIKKMVENISAAAPEDRNDVLRRVNQWLKIIRYYKDADRNVRNLLNRNSNTNNRSLSEATVRALKITGNYTPCHYEYLGINIHNRTNLLGAKKEYVNSLRLTIKAVAGSFKEMYDRVGDEFAKYVVKTYGAAVRSFTCMDRGIALLTDTISSANRRFPAGNFTNWKGTVYNVKTVGGSMTPASRANFRNKILQPFMASQLERNANAFNNSHKLWNAVRNKNLKINGAIRKVQNLGRTEVNNYHRYVYG